MKLPCVDPNKSPFLPNTGTRYIAIFETGDAAPLKTFRGKHIKDANGVYVPLLDRPSRY